MVHFGAKLREKPNGMKMTRENYADVSNKGSLGFFGPKEYEDKAFHELLEKAMINYDLNIKYFADLDRKDFDNVVKLFLRKHRKFKEVKDLNEYSAVSGYYLMILDEYKQVYLGTTSDIKKRVLSHWSKTMPIDRRVLGTVETSKLSINSFRALDTTRLYALTTFNTYSMENDLINDIPKQYQSNRLDGGKLDTLTTLPFALDIYEKVKCRELHE